jgi:hypothetical protein
MIRKKRSWPEEVGNSGRAEKNIANEINLLDTGYSRNKIVSGENDRRRCP